MPICDASGSSSQKWSRKSKASDWIIEGLPGVKKEPKVSPAERIIGHPPGVVLATETQNSSLRRSPEGMDRNAF